MKYYFNNHLTMWIRKNVLLIFYQEKKSNWRRKLVVHVMMGGWWNNGLAFEIEVEEKERKEDEWWRWPNFQEAIEMQTECNAKVWEEAMHT